MNAIVAAIPPPPFSVFHIGPLTIRMYGIMIGLGVLAAVWLTGRLFEERGIGDVDDAASIAVWGVLAGIVGARLYHVVTDFQNFRGDNFVNVFKIWTGGLGIPGGILFGTLVGVWVAKRRGIPVLPALSCAAPAIPLAQAIGRIGNYFNQELFGRPTTLPWGLEISDSVNTGYPAGTLFHPTFLYESLWNVGLCLALVWLFHHRTRLQPGRLFPLYMAGYGVGRLWIESLRIDPANKIGPFRTNIWMALLLIIAGTIWFVMSRNSTARWPHPLRLGGGHESDDASEDERDHVSDDARDQAAAGAAVSRGAEDRDATQTAGDAIDGAPAASENKATAQRSPVEPSAGVDQEDGTNSDDVAKSAATANRATDETSAAKAATPPSSDNGPVAARSSGTGSSGTGSSGTGSSGTGSAAAESATEQPATEQSATDESATGEAGTKRSPAKKSLARKTRAKKTPAEKPPAEKKPAEKRRAKKTPAEKKPAKKTRAKKSAAKKSPAKRSSVKKSAAEGSAVKKSAEKPAPKTRRKRAPRSSNAGGASVLDPGLAAAQRAAKADDQAELDDD